jgi:hypothetical protein
MPLATLQKMVLKAPQADFEPLSLLYPALSRMHSHPFFHAERLKNYKCSLLFASLFSSLVYM